VLCTEAEGSGGQLVEICARANPAPPCFRALVLGLTRKIGRDKCTETGRNTCKESWRNRGESVGVRLGLSGRRYVIRRRTCAVHRNMAERGSEC